VVVSEIIAIHEDSVANERVASKNWSPLCSTERRMYVNISRHLSIQHSEGSAQLSNILDNKADRRHVLVPSSTKIIVSECQDSNDSKNDNGPVEIRKSGRVADEDV
jgi:hypothetical protein